MKSLYVYALVDERPEADAALGKGISRRPLSVVTVGRTFVVVEEAEAPPPTAAHLVAHDRVMRRLAKRFAALLPVRFGTVARDRAMLRALVAPRKGELARGFERVRGAVQFTLRVSGKKQRRPKPPAMSGGPGTRWLAERLLARRIPEADSLTDATKPWVREQRSEPTPERAPRLGTIYQLVSKSDVRSWRGALTRAIPKLPRDVTVSVSGPWPAYAFVEESA